jgi:hypothetical protein
MLVLSRKNQEAVVISGTNGFEQVLSDGVEVQGSSIVLI